MTNINLDHFKLQMGLYFQQYQNNNFNSNLNFIAYTQSRSNGMNSTDLFQMMENFLEGGINGDGEKANLLSSDRYYSQGNQVFMECEDGTVIYFNAETGQVLAGNEATQALLNLKNVQAGSYDDINFNTDNVTFTNYTFAGLKDGENKTTSNNVVTQELDLRNGKTKSINAAWGSYLHDHGNNVSLKDFFGEETYKNDGSFSGSHVQYLDDNTAIIYQEYGARSDEFSDQRPINNAVYKVVNENGKLVIQPLDDDTITSLIRSGDITAPTGVTACPPGAMRVWNVGENGKINFNFIAQMNKTDEQSESTVYQTFSTDQIDALSSEEKAAAQKYLLQDTFANGAVKRYKSDFVIENGRKTNKPVFIIAQGNDGSFRLFQYDEDEKTYKSVVDTDEGKSNIDTLYVLAANYANTGANVSQREYSYDTYTQNKTWDVFTEQYALQNGSFTNLGIDPSTDKRNIQIKDTQDADQFNLKLMLTSDKYMIKTEEKRENESITSKQFISTSEFNSLSAKDQAYIKSNFKESKNPDDSVAGYTTDWLNANKTPKFLIIGGALFTRLSNGRYGAVSGGTSTTYVLNSGGTNINYNEEQKDVFDSTITTKYYDSTTGNIVDSKTEVDYTEDKLVTTHQTKALGVSVYVPPPPPPPPSRDPLILDANKDGKVSAKNDMGIDIDGDGIADGAAIDGDGMLSMGDIDGDGVITGKEVFGDHTINPYTGEKLNAANGFEALRMIALEAEVRSGLKILVNGEVDLQLLKRALELTTNASLGLISGDNNSFLEALGDIKSINVQDYETVESTGGMIEHLQQGSYKDINDNVYKVDDVWFANDVEYLKKLYEYA
ncbi:MAG: hypothetical protein PHX18_08360 [Candidatus Gastranaerophilales bacterium]|nr:hypothetical protein [Candidatus Gastranaerophilales bacterium]